MMNTMTMRETTQIPAARHAVAPQRARFGFGAGMRAARAALQWRLLLLWSVLLLVPTLAAALPMWQLLSASLDQSVHAATLAAQLDGVALADLMLAQTRSGVALGNGAIVALALTLLLSPLLSGMSITAARSARAPGFRALVAGGVQEYPRLLRMLVWAVVPLGLAAAAANMAVEAAQRHADAAILSADAERATMLALAAAGLLVLLAQATLDAGRATLALDQRRKSAVLAWFAGWKLLARRPLATLGVYLAITVAGLAVVALLAVARLNLPPLGAGGFAGALALTQLAVAGVAWLRSARLFALMEAARAQHP
jgi:hypothetical protein